MENWTNQKLEYPEDFIAEGGRDQWYKPMEVGKQLCKIRVLLAAWCTVLRMGMDHGSGL